MLVFPEGMTPIYASIVDKKTEHDAKTVAAIGMQKIRWPGAEMKKAKTKKCSKIFPLLLTVFGGMYGLAGEGEICGFLWFVAFFAFAFCRLIDSCNEIPATSMQLPSNIEWFDQNVEIEQDPLFSLSRKELFKSDVGPTGAERVFFGPAPEMQVSSSIFESKLLFPRYRD